MIVSEVGRMAIGSARSPSPDLVTHATCLVHNFNAAECECTMRRERLGAFPWQLQPQTEMIGTMTGCFAHAK